MNPILIVGSSLAIAYFLTVLTISRLNDKLLKEEKE